MRRSPSFRSRLGWFVVLFTIALATGAIILGSARAAGVPPPAGLPPCEVAERPAPNSDYSEWDSTLLDPAMTLGRGYKPPDLRVADVLGQQVTLREFVIAPLRSMLAAASEAGVRVWVTSAYRSFADQERLLAINPDSEDEVARAGHSEHQLGTAVDLGGNTDWVRLNAPRFGFVQSYPVDRRPAWTCYRAEPWHFRYFDPERAQFIEASGLSPREWLSTDPR
jgi:D-alanyl-D-alanine carboxypeptidase